MAADILISDGSILMDTGYYPSIAKDIATKEYVDDICTTTTYSDSESKVGEIMMYIEDTPPTGYLLCDGSTHNYDDYPALGALLGGSVGGTFDTPDINFAKNSKGLNTLTQEPEHIGVHNHTAASHRHNVDTTNSGSHAHTFTLSTDVVDGTGAIRYAKYIGLGNTRTDGTHSHNVSISNKTYAVNSNAGTNQPACILLNFCIKY